MGAVRRLPFHVIWLCIYIFSIFINYVNTYILSGLLRCILLAFVLSNFSAGLNVRPCNILSPERFTRKENTPHNAPAFSARSKQKRPKAAPYT